jgi:hypothetical protein
MSIVADGNTRTQTPSSWDLFHHTRHRRSKTFFLRHLIMRHRVSTAALCAALGVASVASLSVALSSSSSARHTHAVYSTTLGRSAAALPRTRSAHSVLRSSSLNPEDQTNSGDNDGDNDDEECPDEEECEIDWSKMPGMGDDEEAPKVVQPPTETTKTSTTSSSTNEMEQLRALLERQFQLESAPHDAKADMQQLERYSSSSSLSPHDVQVPEASTKSTTTALTSTTSTVVDFGRRRLEMQWGLSAAADECDVYEPITCGGHACPSCAGQGSCPCRFCRGTGQLYLQLAATTTTSSRSPFVACSVCSAAGYEPCRPCQGSGWIADWTEIGVRVGGLLPK